MTALPSKNTPRRWVLGSNRHWNQPAVVAVICGPPVADEVEVMPVSEYTKLEMAYMDLWSRARDLVDLKPDAYPSRCHPEVIALRHALTNREER